MSNSHRVIETVNYRGYTIRHVELLTAVGSKEIGIETIPTGSQWKVFQDDEHISDAYSLQHARQDIDALLDV